MMITPAHSLSLLAHSDYPAPGVRALQVDCQLLTDGGCRLRYRLEGDLASLRLPEPSAPVEPDRLWAHTCFELFLARAGQAAYREYNFSPSGQWAGYAFSDYRQRAAGQVLPAPILDWSRVSGALLLEARLLPEALPSGSGPLQIGLTTVVELADGSLSYWALNHPTPRPDFHHRDGFTLTLTTTP